MKRIIFASLLFLTGCALIPHYPTPYQPLSQNGGYSEVKLNQDTYSIMFKGNFYTPRDTVAKYVVYRAAQITKENGYKYFIGISSSEQPTTDIKQRPTTIINNGYSSFGGNGSFYGNSYGWQGNNYSFGNATIVPGRTRVYQAWEDHVVIKMLKSNKSYPNALVADDILGSIQVNQNL